MGPHKNVSPTVFYISRVAISSFSPTSHLSCPKILWALLSNYSQNLNTYHHPKTTTLGQGSSSACLDYYL